MRDDLLVDLFDPTLLTNLVDGRRGELERLPGPRHLVGARPLPERGLVVWVTVYGVIAVSFMMTMYALENRNPRYVLGFALGCLLSSSYGFLSGAWPFGVVEAVWSVIAVQRYRGMVREGPAF